ncbi:MAG: tRNA (adenosine(37)-N6)-dimethylallyltransferase MiaA [Prevotellaceae bacterium]|jgi:tRNA dimethylallyltransferase|nr:tRNA (adenosine(37)-N6)-dimethylallyltransferase MiaA [Prevotellaceae bacterium]
MLISNPHKNTLIVLVGPTGVGKTDLSIKLAQTLGCAIVSADSRQFFRELKIGTAAPDETQLTTVKHYFIGHKSITENYNAGQYEVDVLALLERLFAENPVQMLVGGSMMYVDAVCRGLDEIPAVGEEIRQKTAEIYAQDGIEGLQQELLQLDPTYYEKVDLSNYRRVAHAVEISLTTGKPYSDLLTHKAKPRPFNIIKIGLNMSRSKLYERINYRVDLMMEEGLLQEAEQFYPYKDFNSLKTVGYRELFDFWDGKYTTLDEAVAMIKQDSRRYAKRQLTWFNADKTIHWFEPTQFGEIFALLHGILSAKQQ